MRYRISYRLRKFMCGSLFKISCRFVSSILLRGMFNSASLDKFIHLSNITRRMEMFVCFFIWKVFKSSLLLLRVWEKGSWKQTNTQKKKLNAFVLVIFLSVHVSCKWCSNLEKLFRWDYVFLVCVFFFRHFLFLQIFDKKK